MDPKTRKPHNTKGAKRQVGDDEDEEAIGKAIGERAGRLRTQVGISQRALQLAAGLGHGYLSTLESGRLDNPGIAQLYKIAAALSVPLSRLLTDDEEALVTSSPEQLQSSTSESPIATMAIEVDPELQDVQDKIADLWRLDKERFSALKLIVDDLQEKATSKATEIESER